MNNDGFKETEIGLIPKEWKLSVFSDVINVNPRRTIKKGTKVRFVSMGDIREFDKKIREFSFRKFSGGSKFTNEDTIMARITPSLENGKTSFVDILDENEIAAGSTEFIVLSAKKDKTIPHYVYYLTISPEVRKEVINSMTGTSGRQRVENDVFNQIQIPIPPLYEQSIITNFLSSLDQKIELNQKMNQTLEKIGQAIFKHWFIDFEFPDDEGKPYKSSNGKMVDSELGEIPKGWKVGTFGEIADNFDSKRIPLSGKEREVRKGKYPYYGAASIMDYIDDYIFDGIYVLMSEDGSNVVDNKGKPLLQYVWGKFWVNNHAHVLKGKQGFPDEYIYFILKNSNMNPFVTGAAQPKINQKNMNSLNVTIPDFKTLLNFSSVINPLFAKYRALAEENENLSEIRDLLLPRLMSGKIRVTENITTDQHHSETLEALE